MPPLGAGGDTGPTWRHTALVVGQEVAAGVAGTRAFIIVPFIHTLTLSPPVTRFKGSPVVLWSSSHRFGDQPLLGHTVITTHLLCRRNSVCRITINMTRKERVFAVIADAVICGCTGAYRGLVGLAGVLLGACVTTNTTREGVAGVGGVVRATSGRAAYTVPLVTRGAPPALHSDGEGR